MLFVLMLPTVARCAGYDSPALFERFFENKLNHGYSLVRVDGIVGLGRFGGAGAAAKLAEVSEQSSGFERLLALWALARTGTPEARAEIDSAADEERARLEEGSFYELAARTAFLAAYHSGSAPHLFDRVLPPLYNRARRGDLEERLLAAWALYEIGSPVTAATADEAMAAAVAELDPGRGNYTRHLLLIRLVGPPAAESMTPKLKSLVRSHPFEPGLAPKRSLTAFTLAFIAYPKDLPVVAEFREKLGRDLEKPFRDFGALEDIRALGPFACTTGLVEKLRENVVEQRDDQERELAEENLRMCGSG